MASEFGPVVVCDRSYDLSPEGSDGSLVNQARALLFDPGYPRKSRPPVDHGEDERAVLSSEDGIPLDVSKALTPFDHSRSLGNRRPILQASLVFSPFWLLSILALTAKNSKMAFQISAVRMVTFYEAIDRSDGDFWTSLLPHDSDYLLRRPIGQEMASHAQFERASQFEPSRPASARSTVTQLLSLRRLVDPTGQSDFSRYS